MDDRQQLSDDIQKKMKTIMVGSLAIIEEELEDFLNENPDIYNKIRKRIFDNGNAQINYVERAIQTYDVKSRRFKLKLPIVGKKDGNAKG